MSSHKECFCQKVEAVISFWQSLSDIKVLFLRDQRGAENSTVALKQSFKCPQRTDDHVGATESQRSFLYLMHRLFMNLSLFISKDGTHEAGLIIIFIVTRADY